MSIANSLDDHGPTSILFAKKLKRLSTPAEYICKFAEACVIPIILYCLAAIFPGVPKQNFALLRRSITLISNVCDLSFSYLTNLVCESEENLTC